MITRAVEMAPLVKWFLHKHEDLNSDRSSHEKMCHKYAL